MLLLSSLSTIAQVKTKHMANYDAKTIRFGYYIGLSQTHFQVKHLPTFDGPENLETTDFQGPVYAVTSPNATAIRAGAMINMFINDFFDIRFSPLNISVLERRILYEDENHEEQYDNLSSKAWMEIPFHVKYKSERRDNSRMYFFAGTRWGFETNIRSRRGNVATTVNKSLRTNDLMLEYGVGLEFFRPYFKMTPELHFSHGLFNMIRRDDDRHHLKHIKNLKTHNVSFVILFQ